MAQVSDNFDRGGGAELVGSGPGWIGSTGLWVTSTSGKAARAGSGTATALLPLDTADQIVTGRLDRQGGQSHLVARASADASNYYYAGANGSGKYTIGKVVAGTGSQLVTMSTATAAAGDLCTLSVIGTALSLSVNGTVQLSTSDSSVASGSYVGVRGTAATAQPTVDNFSAEDNVPAAPGAGEPLPLLLGRQSAQRLRASVAATLTALVLGTVRVHQGFHQHPAVSIGSPTLSTGLVKAISPHRHTHGGAAMSAPTLESHTFVGYRASVRLVLSAPIRPRALAHRSFLILETPGQMRDFRFTPTSLLWYFYEEAESIARIAGQWVAQFIPVPDEVPGLDRFYRGGHRHYITPDVADELTAAGFGDFIRTEVLK